MFKISSRYHNKTGINLQPGSTISAHRNPNYLSIQLGARSKKKCCPTKRSAYHIHFDMTMHDILGFSEVKNAFLSLHARLGEPFLWKVLSIRSISYLLLNYEVK